MNWRITDVDYWENDAILEIGSDRHYFQFPGQEATLANALEFLFREGNIRVAKPVSDTGA